MNNLTAIKIQNLTLISTHKSDLVRSWITVIIGSDSQLTIQQTHEYIRPFAAGKHFNVRECAWGAIRHKIIHNLDKSLKILSTWTTCEDENIRRFASEDIRPRGVWCEHISVLKENPELGLSIIDPLMTDSLIYVQNSVGNWLNDASNSKETYCIIKKALRTIEKNTK